jgi:oxygen-independent coproporphyrinogen-3 oxidase
MIIDSVRLAALPPLSLYIHFPWCVRKCPYCDFNSHEKKGDFDEVNYVDALIQDLEMTLPLVWGRSVQTIFMGGGTPSLFSAQALERLLSAIRARLRLDPQAEITLEANPGTFEAEKFKDYRAAGINRLSIGIQSFSDQHLQRLGRIHNATEAYKAIEIAHHYFDNFNLDLMYALPEQTLLEAEADIQAAIKAEAPHLSAYQLTLEPNTLFHRYPPNLPDDDIAANMQEMIEAKLATLGYQHYETSAFAKPQRRARHNLNYWQFGDYLGIGAGAHAKISFPDKILRQMRYKQPAQYLAQLKQGTPIQTEHMLAPADLPFEFMLNAMRLTEGFLLSLFTERTGLPLTVILKQLDRLEEQGFIWRDHRTLQPTLQGQRFLNTVLQQFLTS